MEKQHGQSHKQTEPYVSSRTSLLISGLDVDFEWITTTLAIRPTSRIKRGESITKRTEPNKIDVWVYTAEVEKNRPVEEHLKALADKVAPRLEELRDICAKWSVVIRCSYHTDLAQGWFVIPPDVAVFFGQLGIPIEVSILSWGGVIDE